MSDDPRQQAFIAPSPVYPDGGQPSGDNPNGGGGSQPSVLVESGPSEKISAMTPATQTTGNLDLVASNGTVNFKVSPDVLGITTFLTGATGTVIIRAPSASTHSGSVEIIANGVGPLILQSGTADITMFAGNHSIGLTAHDNLTLTTQHGHMFLAGLPSTDPHVVGALWNNAGVVTISAG